jgi:tetratricopeptide (TPR) repeat protein
MAKFSQEFLRQAASPMGSVQGGLLSAVGGAATLPQQLRQQQQAQEQKKQLSQIDTNTPQGLMELAKFYQSQGDMENAVKYAKAARDLQEQGAAQAQLSAFQEQVAVAAEAAGLTEQAATARATTDMDELRGISKDIRAFQIEQLPLDNPQVIKARLKMAGFTPAQITAMGTLSADEADALLKGRTGKLEAWQDSEGKIQAVNVNDFGLVYNDQTNTYVKASELGLVRKAPQVQEVIDKGQEVGVKAMAEANVNNFVELNTKAQDARDMIELIDRQTGRLEGGMPTGLAANVELNLRRFGELIGLPYDPAVTNAETFISEAGKIVADQIKDFGSGTGLSDADREYAKLIAAADITTQQEALFNLLKIRRQAMVETVQNFNKVRTATAKRVGEQNMTSFPSITMPEEAEEAEAVLPEGFELDQ